MAKLLCAVSIVIAFAAVHSQLLGDEPVPPSFKGKTFTLLGELADWKYPNSTMPKGATVSDGGNPEQRSANFKALLTTPDSFEKVVEYYESKSEGIPGQSVCVQDDTEGRPVAVRSILVNRKDSSTTIVISRADGEKETHIVWLHNLRFSSP